MNSRPAVSWRSFDVILAAVGLGLLAGAVEVLVHLVKDRIEHRTLLLGPEYVWQVPLGDAVLFTAVAVLLLAASLLVRRLRGPRLVMGVFGTLAALAGLMLTERIHLAAEAVLAVGIGVAAARATAPDCAALARRLRRWVPAALAALALLGAGRWAWAARSERARLASMPAASPGRPNILILVLDTVRAWSMGLYGHPRPTTPKLQSWAARGVLFDRALAPSPWTTLSHAVMFTGRQPTEVSVGWDRPLDGREPTLAEVLSAAGYATGGFVANYLQAGRPTGLARGFVHYEDYPSTPLSIMRRLSLLRRFASQDRVGALLGRRRVIDALPARRVSDRFLAWADQPRGRPWFAFLNYYEAHGPYLPPEPFETRYSGPPGPAMQRYWQNFQQAYGRPILPVEDLAVLMDAYDGAINYLDEEVDRVLRTLESRGALANTIVVITSDHGELFGEHGIVAHGNNLYLPVLHVPLLVVAPGRVPGAVRVQTLASLRDLPATILELAAIPNPGLPGRSLVPSWNPLAPPPGPDTLFAAVEYNRLLSRWPPSPVLLGTMKSVVLDSLQYILNGDGREELYHLGQDSWQVRNLAGDSAFRADLERYRGALRALPVNPRWARGPS